MEVSAGTGVPPPEGEPEHVRTRRGFLGFAGRAGVTVVGAAAGLMALRRQAEAEVAATWRCCSLAHGNPDCPINSSGSYYCNHGRMGSWTCCSGSRTYACAECSDGGGCGSGTIYCSAGWTTNPNGCSTARPAGRPTADPAQLAAWRNGDYQVATHPVVKHGAR
jgi:hypothetical protein